jgi:hypothetical protein
VDLPLPHIQIDAVECDDIAETLGDPASPDCRPGPRERQQPSSGRSSTHSQLLPPSVGERRQRFHPLVFKRPFAG